MKAILSSAILACVAFVAFASEGPALVRLDEINALLRAGDEVRLRAYVEVSFADSMRRASPGDPGILPFLLQLSRRHRGFEIVRTIGAPLQGVTAVVRSVAEPSRIFRLNLAVEPAAPHRIAGFFLLAAAPEDLPEETPDLTPERAIESFAKQIDRLVGDGFSGVVLLARGSDVVLQRAAGESDRGLHAQNTLDTVFGLASMNKMFTAVAVAQLVEQGKLGYADPVGRHLKGWLPEDLAARVTVEQLLTHTSGLGDYLPEIESDPKLRSARTLAAYRDLIRRSKVEGKPEDGLRYSNTGYVVLGALIEAITGRDYFDFVRSEIYAPAGMTRAFLCNSGAEAVEAALASLDGHGLRIRTIFNPFYMFFGATAGATRMAPWKYYLASAAGKIVKATYVAYLGHWGMGYILEWLHISTET